MLLCKFLYSLLTSYSFFQDQNFPILCTVSSPFHSIFFIISFISSYNSYLEVSSCHKCEAYALTTFNRYFIFQILFYYYKSTFSLNLFHCSFHLLFITPTLFLILLLPEYIILLHPPPPHYLYFITILLSFLLTTNIHIYSHQYSD